MLQETFVPQEKNKKEIQRGDIGTILTFLAICFHTLKKACSKCTTQGF
jgi:hypothetical protein